MLCIEYNNACTILVLVIAKIVHSQKLMREGTRSRNTTWDGLIYFGELKSAIHVAIVHIAVCDTDRQSQFITTLRYMFNSVPRCFQNECIHSNVYVCTHTHTNTHAHHMYH